MLCNKNECDTVTSFTPGINMLCKQKTASYLMVFIIMLLKVIVSDFISY